MNDQGELFNRSLSELRTTPNGGALQLFLTDTVPPYGTIVLTCHDVLIFNIQRTAGDESPFFLGEIRWQPVAREGVADKMSRLGYSFFDERGRLLEPGWGQVVHVHFEGSVCGDALCRGCSIQEESHSVGTAHTTKTNGRDSLP
jgi:hypothetical protein